MFSNKVKTFRANAKDITGNYPLISDACTKITYQNLKGSAWRKPRGRYGYGPDGILYENGTAVVVPDHPFFDSTARMRKYWSTILRDGSFDFPEIEGDSIDIHKLDGPLELHTATKFYFTGDEYYAQINFEDFAANTEAEYSIVKSMLAGLNSKKEVVQFQVSRERNSVDDILVFRVMIGDRVIHDESMDNLDNDWIVSIGKTKNDVFYLRYKHSGSIDISMDITIDDIPKKMFAITEIVHPSSDILTVIRMVEPAYYGSKSYAYATWALPDLHKITYDDNFTYKSIVPRMPNELIAVVNGSTVSFIDSVNHRLWFHHTLPPFHVYDIDMADGQFIMATSQGLYILDFQKDAGFYFADNKLYRTIGDMIDHKAFNENWAIVGDFILPGTGIEDISVRGCATQYINNKKYLTFSYKNRGVVVAQMDFKSNLFTLLGNFLAGNPKVFSPVSQFEAGHVWLATNGDLYFVNKSDSISTGLWAVYDIRTATGISYYYDDARIKYVKTLKGRSGAGFKNNNVLILGVQNNIMILDTDEYNSNIVLLDNTILPEVSSVFGISYDFKGYLISEDTVIYNGQLVTGVTGLSELSLNNSLIISQSVINGTISDICEGGSVYVATDVGVTSDQESNILEGLTFESVTPLTPYVTEVVFNRDISDVSDIIDLTDKDNYEFGIPIFEIKQISERVVNIVTRHSQIEDREYRLRLWVAA